MYWLGTSALIFEVIATVIATVCAYDAVLTADSTLRPAGEGGAYNIGNFRLQFRSRTVRLIRTCTRPLMNAWDVEPGCQLDCGKHFNIEIL